MQIGADVYCDSMCIIRELERRFPEHSLFPGNSGHTDWGLARWTDGPLFTSAITIVLGAAAELPEDFARDRGRLYFGPDFKLEDVRQQVVAAECALRSQFGWVEKQLSDGRQFVNGAAVGLADALVYHLVWFLRGRWERGGDFLSAFPRLADWEQRILEIGHGTPRELDSAAALDIAATSTPAAAGPVDAADPAGLASGDIVRIVPEFDGGDPEVEGKLHSLDQDTISILRTHERVGKIVNHYPRVGYRIARQESL